MVKGLAVPLLRFEAKLGQIGKQTMAKKKKTLTVTQIGSPIGRPKWQRANLVGLGLDKLHKSRTLEDTPSVRGMINRVHHLVHVEDEA